MKKDLIREVLEDYLQALYRSGTSEDQDKVKDAIRELDK